MACQTTTSQSSDSCTMTSRLSSTPGRPRACRCPAPFNHTHLSSELEHEASYNKHTIMMSSSFCASRSLLTLLGSEAKRYETFVNTNYVLNLCEASIHPYVDFELFHLVRILFCRSAVRRCTVLSQHLTRGRRMSSNSTEVSMAVIVELCLNC